MNKKTLIFISSSLLWLTPLLAGAVGKIQQVIQDLEGIVGQIVVVLMIAAVAVFLWGIVKYIMAAGSEDKAKEAKSYIIYGLIGLFVLVTFWGIIQIAADFFDISPGGTITLPKIQIER